MHTGILGDVCSREGDSTVEQKNVEIMNSCHLSLIAAVQAVTFYLVAYICFAFVLGIGSILVPKSEHHIGYNEVDFFTFDYI